MVDRGLAGVRIVSSNHLTIGPFEDWTDVRSHGRAKRRLRQGHKQRIRYFFKPDPSMYQMPDGSMVGHPETVRALNAALEARHD